MWVGIQGISEDVILGGWRCVNGLVDSKAIDMLAVENEYQIIRM